MGISHHKHIYFIMIIFALKSEIKSNINVKSSNRTKDTRYKTTEILPAVTGFENRFKLWRMEKYYNF